MHLKYCMILLSKCQQRLHPAETFKAERALVFHQMKGRKMFIMRESLQCSYGAEDLTASLNPANNICFYLHIWNSV